MLTKEQLLETIKDMPEKFSVDELFERIVFSHKLEVGIQQSNSGETLSTEEARRKLQKWLLK